MPYHYGQDLINENRHRKELFHKSLMIYQSYILFLLHSTSHNHKQNHQDQESLSIRLCTKLYKILLNIFYESFNNKLNCHHHQKFKNMQFVFILQNGTSINISIFSDLHGELSTNSVICGFLFIINGLNRVGCQKHQEEQHSRYIVTSSLNFLHNVLLTQHAMRNNNYRLFAQNQTKLYATKTWFHNYQQNHSMKLKTLNAEYSGRKENCMITLGKTSNHMLNTTAESNKSGSYNHGGVKFSKEFHRTVRNNDSFKGNFNAILFLIILCIPFMTNASSVHNIKYSTNVVKTKYGPLRGIILRSNPSVEGYLGIPYATPPLGALRYMPPVTPSTWKNTRLADHFSPVCPQSVSVSDTGNEALLEMPRGRLTQLRRMKLMLSNHSEDCLYLNMYVPREDETGASIEKPMATLIYIHGESYEWNSGNLYDGTVLAAHSQIIVVTINFRLGVLGFLKTGSKGSAQGNFGLMDLVAGLHWLRENLPAFNGNPNMVTIMGHGHGAALANILIVSPVCNDLVHRAILISGSALSPWAIQQDPLSVKKKVAADTGCHGDLLEDDLAPCLRKKSISELLAIKLDPPRFLPGFAPFVDGTVIVNPSLTPVEPISMPAASAVAGLSGLELADFSKRELLFGVTSIESYLDFSAQDLEFGFNETRRDRILRTYVRNVYHFHLNEIFSALKNEYTDWERPPRNQLGSRDAALELLSDGHTVAPLIRLGYLHSLRGGKSFFMHYKHRTDERDFPQRYGTVRGEDVPFCLGLPLTQLFPYNFSQQDIQTSRILIHYLANFIQTGNPNGDATPKSRNSIDLNSLKRLGTRSISHYTEFLPSPLSLSSSSTKLSLSSQRNQEHDSTVDSISKNMNNNSEIVRKTENSGRIEYDIKKKQQSQFNHYVPSSTKSRHRRSLAIGNRQNNPNRRFISKRYIVKRNFPNNQLSKASNEIDEDDETELDEINDFMKEEHEKKGKEDGGEEKLEKKKQGKILHHDRLKDGDDNENDFEKSSELMVPYWDAYDIVNQLFLEISAAPEIKNHYRGHKLSMWLSLIPQIHSPGDSLDLSMRHHHFNEENSQYYDGKVRSQSIVRPNVMKINAPSTTSSPKYKTEKSPSRLMPLATSECPPNVTIVPTIAATRPHQNQDSSSVNSLSLLRRLTSSHYQSYATALTVTIAVGCFLLLLNVFIFAAIYYQREKRATYAKKKEELTETEMLNSSSSPSLEQYQQKDSRKSSLQSVSGNGFGEYSCYDKPRCKEKRSFVDLCTVELPMQELKYSPPSSTTGSIRRSITPDNHHNKHSIMDKHSDAFASVAPPGYTPGSNNLITYRSIVKPKTELCNQSTQADSPPSNTRRLVYDANTTVNEDDHFLSPDIPNPPPPPRASFQSGILRQGISGPSTPGTTKKRVQIREISV